MNNEKVNIELTRDEALLLVEYFSMFKRQARREQFRAEIVERVIANIEGEIEQELKEGVRVNYLEILQKTREIAD